MRQFQRLAYVLASVLIVVVLSADVAWAKEGRAFFTPAMVARARENVAKYPWAAAIRDDIVKAAGPWVTMSDDQLWPLMFGHTITRSWMVWSNGYCPACTQNVPMYTWEIAAFDRPWKVRCPHCKQVFPKNDFHAFYQSGLDEHNVFDPKRADRSLLFNAEHPGANDPLRTFGVDDGEGYVEGDKRWRFIGAYLIYGQFKQAIVAGCRRLADAYLLTGDERYAHKAAVLLDRVADLYPTFDFANEGKVYEVSGVAGYVSTWHDACWETRELVLTYDMVLSGILHDDGLQQFLAAKAKRYKLDNPKASIADIRRNIETRILVDCQANRPKIESNYPQTDITIAFAKTALAWPDNRDEVNAVIAGIVKKSTAVDGTTGEKGLSGYSALGIRGLGDLLSTYARMDAAFLPEMFKRTTPAPTASGEAIGTGEVTDGSRSRLHDAFRFHIDAWCLQRYYPSCGDAGSFCQPVTVPVAFNFSRSATLLPSMFSFAWQLYEQTHDERFVQALHAANEGKLDGLPYDLFGGDPEAFRSSVRQVIDRVGTRIDLPSVNKQQWHLGLLRSGKGEHERVMWLDYDSGGGHSHLDGMNLGLFARGLDLLPDFGYPPVQYGGWGAPRSRWYHSTAAHNTVVVDGQDLQRNHNGVTTLWADGRQLHAIAASCPGMIGGAAYERISAMIDLSDSDSYIVDVFRVVGGSEHAKFTRSHFGKLTTQGVLDTPPPETGKSLLFSSPHMRNWRGGDAAAGWTADWTVENRLKIAGVPDNVHLRYMDLTQDAQAYTGETWVSIAFSGSSFQGNEEAWIPHVMTRRHASKMPLASTFVAVMEPYVGASQIASIRRLPLPAPSVVRPGGGAAVDVAIEVVMTDGRRDLFVLAGDANAWIASQPESVARVVVGKDLRMDGRMCLIRRDKTGTLARICLGQARSLETPGISVRLRGETPYIEMDVTGHEAKTLAGDPSAIEAVKRN